MVATRIPTSLPYRDLSEYLAYGIWPSPEVSIGRNAPEIQSFLDLWPEYAQPVLQTGRPRKDTDLSSTMENLLAAESPTDQERLLQLIHKHGEAKVMEALRKSPVPQERYGSPPADLTRSDESAIMATGH